MKLSTVKTFFRVNEKRKVVVCICDFYLKYEGRNFPIRTIHTRACARCHNDDVFNSEVGKKIARAKAEAKAYKQALFYTKLCLKPELRKVNDLIAFMNKANRCMSHNKEYIQRISE